MVTHLFIFTYLSHFNVFLRFLVLDSKKIRTARSKQVAVSPSGTMGSDSPVTTTPNSCSGPHSGKQETHAAGKLKWNHIYLLRNVLCPSSLKSTVILQ